VHLFVVRHGKAHRDSPTGADFDRELKPRGARQARWLGAVLGERDDAPRLIVTSPLVRALQTATLLNESLGVGLLVDERLDTETSVSRVLTLIAGHADAGSLAIVGHNPTLSVLGGSLVGGPGAAVELRTGACLRVQIDPHGAIGSGSEPELLRHDDADS